MFERVVPMLSDAGVAHLIDAAQVCDGLVKGLKHPDWPLDPWHGLKRLVLMLVQQTSAPPAAARRRADAPRLALHA